MAEPETFASSKSHGRLPWPRPDELDARRLDVYNAIAGGPRAVGSAFALTDSEGRLEGPFNAMLVCPDLGDAVQTLGSVLRYRTSLSDRSREIAILVVAAEVRSDFEWYAHERVGRKCGLSEDEMDTLKVGGEAPATFSSEELLVHELARSLVRDRDIADPLFARARSELGLEPVQGVVVLVGYYRLLDLAMRAWRTPLPPGTASPF